MNQLAELRKSIVALLSTAPELHHLEIRTDYNGLSRQLPIKKPTLAVGLNNISLVEAGMGNMVGVLQQKALTGQLAEITFRFDLVIPQTTDSFELYDVFENLCWVLLQSSLGISSVECEKIYTSTDSLSSGLVAKAHTKLYLSKQETTREWSDFYVTYKKE